MKRWQRLIAFLLCLLLPVFPASAESAESGELRVYLKSLAGKAALRLTLSGRYSVDGDPLFQFAPGTEISVRAWEGALLLEVGGLSMGMGEEFTLKRHAYEGENGVYIDGSQRGKLYAGDLLLRNDGGSVQAILHIDIEDYLYGVVPYEMSDSFPLEALKAQAVAARTYALRRRADSASRRYDVVDTTADQVFMGYDPAYTNAIQAVDETRGIAGLYKGEYASCFYTASNGGQTALADLLSVSGDYGYLDIYDDPYDVENPSSVVRRLTYKSDASDLGEPLTSMLKMGLAEQLAAMGYSDEADDIEIVSIVDMQPHTPLLNEAYRMYGYLRVSVTVRVRPLLPVYEIVPLIEKIRAAQEKRPVERKILGYTRGEMQELTEPLSVDLTVFEQLKDQLGLKVSYIDCELVSVVREDNADGSPAAFSIEMRRYGHGVGMSQRGAQWMAKEYGKLYTDILSFYYPGLTFSRLDLPAEELTPLAILSVSAAPTPVPTPTPTQAPLPALAEGEYYARVTLGSAASNLNVRLQPSTSAPIIGELPDDWRVIVQNETADGWSYVKTADMAGYVYNVYLTKE